jgi:hypothetical protein
MRPVPADLVPQVWPHVVEILQSAAEFSGGKYDAEDFYMGCRDGESILVVNRELDCAAIVEVATWPKMKTLLVVLLGGGPGIAWELVTNSMAHLARELGCTHLEAYTRPGFQKIMASLGAKMTHNVHLLEVA